MALGEAGCVGGGGSYEVIDVDFKCLIGMTVCPDVTSVKGFIPTLNLHTLSLFDRLGERVTRIFILWGEKMS